MDTWVQRILDGKVLAHNAAVGYSLEFEVGRFSQVLLTCDLTNALTGGSTPGVTFGLEIDTNGKENWVAAPTLIATANGFSAAGVADLGLTSTTKGYRLYPQTAGVKARVKHTITGTPTGGTATISVDVHQKRG